MKQFYLYLACLLFCATASADSTRPHPIIPVAPSGGVQFQFSSISPCRQHKDSVLIIFDRCNHTGAGIIYQVYTADEAHCITIPAVPAGKYFVTIQCLGLHHDRVEKKIRIRAKKNEKVRIEIANSEVFTKDTVIIPAYHPNFAHLSVLKTK